MLLVSCFTLGLNFTASGLYPEVAKMGVLELTNIPYTTYLRHVIRILVPMLLSDTAVLVISPLPRPGLTAPLPAPSLFFPCRCAIMGLNFRASGPEAHLVRNGAYNYDFSGIDAAAVFAAQVQR